MLPARRSEFSGHVSRRKLSNSEWDMVSDPIALVAANGVGEGEGEGVGVVIIGRVHGAGCDSGKGIRL